MVWLADSPPWEKPERRPRKIEGGTRSAAREETVPNKRASPAFPKRPRPARRGTSESVWKLCARMVQPRRHVPSAWGTGRAAEKVGTQREDHPPVPVPARSRPLARGLSG